jgi:hypothetical protein
MVTNVPFYSFKDVSLKKSVPFVVHRRAWRWCIAVDRPAPAGGAVRPVLRVRRLGLRGVRLAPGQGPAGRA